MSWGTCLAGVSGAIHVGGGAHAIACSSRRVYACSRQASCILRAAIGGVAHQQEDPRGKRDAAEDTRQRLVGGQVGAVADDGHVHASWVQRVSGRREWGIENWESCQSSSRRRPGRPGWRAGKKLETVLDSFSEGMTQRAPDGSLGRWRGLASSRAAKRQRSGYST